MTSTFKRSAIGEYHKQHMYFTIQHHKKEGISIYKPQNNTYKLYKTLPFPSSNQSLNHFAP